MIVIVIQMVIIRTISIMININDLTKKRYNLSNNKVMIKTMITIVITLIANNGSWSIIIIINLIRKWFYPHRQFLIFIVIPFPLFISFEI